MALSSSASTDVSHPATSPTGKIAVFGAYGHTARFVVRELVQRGWTPVLSGRDGARLQAAAADHPGAEVREAAIEDAASLDRLLVGTRAVINCAGPFGETAPALIEAALRRRVHYLDVTGETLVSLETFASYADPGPRAHAVQQAGVVVAPCVAFYGALGDLLATAAMGDWDSADTITIAVALDSWKPTRGTRLAGERRAGRRPVFSDGQITIRPGDAPVPTSVWNFPPPFGRQDVIGELSTVDVITMSRHLNVRRIDAYLNTMPLADLRDPHTSGPQAADASGRSDQQFVVEVVVQRGQAVRRAAARGRDIYAITAPIVVEAMERILDGRALATGTLAPGQLFEPEDFLRALSPGHLTFTVER